MMVPVISRSLLMMILRSKSHLVPSSGSSSRSRFILLRSFGVRTHYPHPVSFVQTFSVTNRTICTCPPPRGQKMGQAETTESPPEGQGPPPPQDLTLMRQREGRRNTVYYLGAIGVLFLGAAYAAVPLYRLFCQSYGYGGTFGAETLKVKEGDPMTSAGDPSSPTSTPINLSQMTRAEDRPITIRFNADRSSALQWAFAPRQLEIIVHPGETALAFYTAHNKTDRPVDGISTYNVIPFEAGAYFNKIQCFCFEEQRLNPGETVELPVFFYIDPEFVQDPKMEGVDSILLSYTFFEAKELSKLNFQFK